MKLQLSASQTLKLWLLRGYARLRPARAAHIALKPFLTPPSSTRTRAEADLAEDGEWLSSAAVPGVQLYRFARSPSHAAAHSAPYVLCVHGWGSFGLRFRPWFAELHALGLNVICFDHPGHGRSAGANSSLPAFVDCLAKIRAEFGPPSAVIAHSLGAAATAIALSQGALHSSGSEFPARSLRDSEFPARSPRDSQFPARSRRDFNTACPAVLIAPTANVSSACERFVRLLGLPASLNSALFQALNMKMARQWPNFVAEHYDLAHFGTALQAIALDHSGTPQLLVIHDRDDHDVPVSEGRSYQRSVAGLQYVETQGLGHHDIVNADSTRKTALAFLSAALANVASGGADTAKP